MLFALAAACAVALTLAVLLSRKSRAHTVAVAEARALKAPEPDVLWARIRTAMREQAEYEPGHADRQKERLKRGHTAPRRHHGHYDFDQRLHSVLLKVRRACVIAGEAPPDDLRARIAAELKEAERANALDG